MENLYFLIFFSRVYLCAAQTVEITTIESTTGVARTLRVWRIYELEELDQALVPRYETLNDGSPLSKYDALEVECNRKYDKCLNDTKLSYGPVCSHLKDYGLVSFPTVCEINLKNCLIEVRNDKPETKTKKETFYYNKIGKSCDYYVEQTSSMEYAIKMYLLHGKMRKYLARTQHE